MNELHERLATQLVHALLMPFTDVDGCAKGRRVPLAYLDEVLRTGAGSDWGRGPARPAAASATGAGRAGKRPHGRQPTGRHAEERVPETECAEATDAVPRVNAWELTRRATVF